MTRERSTTAAPTPRPDLIPSAGLDALRQQITWSEPAVPGGAQRARITVPVDYRDPAGRTLELALARFPATDPGARLGVLMLAPDDPGSSGIGLAEQVAPLLSASIRAAYDLIGSTTGSAARARRCSGS